MSSGFVPIYLRLVQQQETRTEASRSSPGVENVIYIQERAAAWKRDILTHPPWHKVEISSGGTPVNPGVTSRACGRTVWPSRINQLPAVPPRPPTINESTYVGLVRTSETNWMLSKETLKPHHLWGPNISRRILPMFFFGRELEEVMARIMGGN
jgi:hypothetical protein